MNVDGVSSTEFSTAQYWSMIYKGYATMVLTRAPSVSGVLVWKNYSI